MQRTPARLPLGIPGIGLLMDGAVQHAPQLGLQSITFKIIKKMGCHSVPDTESSVFKRH